MNRNSRINIVALITSLFFLSCFSVITVDCDICLNTSLKSNKDNFVVEMVLISNIDTTLVIPGEVLMVGCPFYQEEQVYFENSKPDLDKLNHTQIILENEMGNFRVFSSEFIDLKEETILRMPDCAFIGEEILDMKMDEKSSLDFNVWYLNDLKVDKADRKVRLHIYYKDKINKKGGVISSSNWIRVNE